MSKILSFLEKNQPDILRDLELLVHRDSPSNSKELCDRCGKTIVELFAEKLGIQGEVFPQSHTGNHYKFTFGQGDEQLLFLGHFDTVWDKGRLSYRVEGNKAFGPGIFDMKSGIIQALWAAKSLKEQKIPLNKKIVFFLNSDEETGSPTSRSIIESEAKKSKIVLVGEPSISNTGGLKTSRKGVGIFNLKVEGVASHAGNHHDKGVNAIEELAHQILTLQGFTDYAAGTTVNVGVAHGGTRSNIVAAEAEAEIDLRAVTLAEAQRMEQLILNLKPKLQGAKVTVTGGMNRPPLERTPAIEKLYLKARDIAQSLGFDLPEGPVGGGSDGNYTAALGIPTLDGLGGVGDGPHAEHEHILVSHLPQRSALLAHLMAEL